MIRNCSGSGAWYCVTEVRARLDSLTGSTLDFSGLGAGRLRGFFSAFGGLLGLTFWTGDVGGVGLGGASFTDSSGASFGTDFSLGAGVSLGASTGFSSTFLGSSLGDSFFSSTFLATSTGFSGVFTSTAAGLTSGSFTTSGAFTSGALGEGGDTFTAGGVGKLSLTGEFLVNGASASLAGLKGLVGSTVESGGGVTTGGAASEGFLTGLEHVNKLKSRKQIKTKETYI